jgi:sulfur carrier protein ThiS
MKIILPDQTVRSIDSAAVPVDRILLDMGISPNMVIIVRNGTLVPEDAIVEPEDEIQLIRIAHGG